MMGTPNRGSFAHLARALRRGKVVKNLAKIDLTGPSGSCSDPQHLPRLLSDDAVAQGRPRQGRPREAVRRCELGRLPVQQALLDSGQAVPGGDGPVTDPGPPDLRRGLRPADTAPDPDRKRPGVPIRVHPQGRWPGDSCLGMLEGVGLLGPEKHGDLVKNPKVIAAIDELLQTGTTTALDDDARPGSRHGRRRTRPWDGARRDIADAEEVPALVASLRSARRAAGSRTMTGTRRRAPRSPGAQRLSWGRPRVRRAARSRRVRRPGMPASARGAGAAPAEAEGGGRLGRHYGGRRQRVRGGQYPGSSRRTPSQGARRAISAGAGRGAPRADRAQSAGVCFAARGDVEFFPWNAGRPVAVAGMGHPGPFGRAQLRRLARNLAWAVASLPASRSMCPVLIGSGRGNPHRRGRAAALFAGLADAFGDASI